MGNEWGAPVKPTRRENFRTGMMLWRAVWSVPHLRMLLLASTAGWVLFIAAFIGLVVK